MEVVEGKYVCIAYDPNRFEPRGEYKKKRFSRDDDDKGTGWGMAQQFFDMRTKLNVNVVTLQAAHPKSAEMQQTVKKQIVELQKLIEPGDVIITGGDFNELGRDLREHDPFVKEIGKGCTFERTHYNGNIDKIGANGPKVLSAESKVVGTWDEVGTCGSDHNAVQLRVTLDV